MKRLALVAVVALASCKTSIDFEQGRPYSCVPDAGDDERACGPGWRCGLESRCHAIGDAKPWPCREDVDCEAGWVCGLEKTCHDPTVIDAYRCEQDRHCTSPWRCGYSGFCLDADAELSVAPPTAVEQLTVLGPRFFTGQEDALVASDAADHFAISVGAQVRAIKRLDAGVFAVTDFDAGTPPTGLLVDPGGPYVVDAKGVRGLSGMQPTYTVDGGAWLVGGTRGGSLFLMEGNTLTSWGIAGGGVTTLQPDTLAVAVENCVYAVNPSGLWVQQNGSLADPSPLSVSGWTHSGCSPISLVTVTQPILRTGGRGRTILAYSGYRTPGAIPIASPPRNFVAAIDVTELSAAPRASDPVGTGSCVLPLPQRNRCPEARIIELMDSCPVPCDVGDVLTDLRPGNQALEVECTGALGQTTWSMRYGNECSAEVLSGTSSRFRETRTPGESSLTPSHLVQRGPHGQLWSGDGVAKAEALVLDQPPLALFRPHALDGGIGAERVVTATHSARVQEQLGLVTVPSPETLAFVSGVDGLVVLESGTVSELEEGPNGALRVAQRRTALDALPEDLKPPVTAALARRGAAAVLLVAANEGLYGADETSWQSKVPLRLVPQPGFSLLSLALLPGPEVSGYVNTRIGVFKFTSRSAQEWEAWPIPLPAGQLLETWVDQGRARVGYADGRVLTLPSGVALTNENERAEVVDYLGVCGQVFALTKRGVLRLDETGHWVDVPLPGGEVVLGDTLAGGRLLESEGSIYVFNGSGGGLSFRLSTGCSP